MENIHFPHVSDGFRAVSECAFNSANGRNLAAQFIHASINSCVNRMAVILMYLGALPHTLLIHVHLVPCTVMDLFLVGCIDGVNIATVLFVHVNINSCTCGNL